MGIYDKKRIVNRFEHVGSVDAWFAVEASQVEVSFSSGDGINTKDRFKMSSVDAVAAAKAILRHYGEE